MNKKGVGIHANPDEGVLCVANGGESTEVEDEDKLSPLWAELQLAESRMLYVRTGGRQTQRAQQAVQCTAHLAQDQFVSCFQDRYVLQAQHSMIHSMCCCHHL